MTDQSLCNRDKDPLTSKFKELERKHGWFVYVDDFTKGFMTVIDRGEHLNIYHIGIGLQQEISVKDLAEKVDEVLGLSVNIVPEVI